MGMGSFNYMVVDVCGNISIVSVMVEVGELDCIFMVMFSMEVVECGLFIGSLLVIFSFDDVYIFQWLNGVISLQINMVEVGSY